MKYTLFALLLLAFVFLYSCEFKNEEGLEKVQCDTLNITYAKVKPIFDVNCVRCHNAQTNYYGILLDSYENAKKAAETGLVVPAVNHIPAPGIAAFMPFQLPKLEDCDLKKITIWVNSGTPQ
jgi:hypothetical protein